MAQIQPSLLSTWIKMRNMMLLQHQSLQLHICRRCGLFASHFMTFGARPPVALLARSKLFSSCGNFRQACTALGNRSFCSCSGDDCCTGSIPQNLGLPAGVKLSTFVAQGFLCALHTTIWNSPFSSCFLHLSTSQIGTYDSLRAGCPFSDLQEGSLLALTAYGDSTRFPRPGQAFLAALTYVYFCKYLLTKAE